MPQVDMSEETYTRLKNIKKPDETVERTVCRLLDDREKIPVGADFTDSKVKKAIIDRKAVSNPNWNNLIDVTLIAIEKRGEEIPDDVGHLKVFNEETKNYRYIPEINKFVSPVSSNNTGIMLRVLKDRYDIPMDIYVRLRNGEEGWILI